MDSFKIGDVIRKLRIKQDITQEQLSEGICSVSKLSKIENNIQIPTKVNFDAFMQRLGRPGEFHYTFVSEHDFKIQELRFHISENTSLRNYDKAFQLIGILEQEKEANDNLNRQFIMYIKAIIQKSKGEDLDKILKLLYDAIRITKPNYDNSNISKLLLTNDELIIINNIAIIEYNKGNRNKAIYIEYEIKNYIEQRIFDNRNKIVIFPMILYNLSKWLGKEERYQEANEICDQGINICIKYGKLTAYGEILLNKACSVYGLGNKKESIIYFKRAYYILDAQENKVYCSLIQEYAKDKFGYDIFEEIA